MYKHFDAIVKKAREIGGGTVAVAGADGKEVLEAIKLCVDEDIIKPVLIGSKPKIEEIAEKVSLDLRHIVIHDMTEETDISELAVQLVHSGEARSVMKGKVNTAVLLRAVLNRKYNLRTSRLISHIAILEVPSYPKLLLVTDGGMVIRPTLEQKADIIRNSAGVMRSLGITKPKIAVLAAIEKTNPEMPETLDAEALTGMSLRGELGEVEVEGPMAIDVALSQRAAQMKGVTSRISGDPDILLVPDIASGNIFAKGLWYLAGAKIGGLAVGARRPIIMLSRSDDAVTRRNSIALAVVVAHGQGDEAEY